MEESDQLHASADLPPRKKIPERNKYDGSWAPRTRHFEMEKPFLLLPGIEKDALVIKFETYSFETYSFYRLRYSGLPNYDML
jgi:hypothetical protein